MDILSDYALMFGVSKQTVEIAISVVFVIVWLIFIVRVTGILIYRGTVDAEVEEVSAKKVKVATKDMATKFEWKKK